MDSPYTIRGSLRHASRLVAVQLLYQIYQSGAEISDVLNQFERWYAESLEEKGGEPQSVPVAPKASYKKVDSDFLRRLVEETQEKKNLLKEVVSPHLKETWTWERLPSILKSILNLALYELLYEKTPKPVVVNEYIELTKNFFDGDEPAFVNGLLDSVLLPE
ncbi:N utilization substance protein B [Alphaproteobacteria bacterium]|nr:N utilization substance protein B [Alphaproteobacteria bacterium]